MRSAINNGDDTTVRQCKTQTRRIRPQLRSNGGALSTSINVLTTGGEGEPLTPAAWPRISRNLPDRQRGVTIAVEAHETLFPT
jgi:hypothetical protein